MDSELTPDYLLISSATTALHTGGVTGSIPVAPTIPTRRKANFLDFVVGCLSLSIGCAVAWLLALYTSRGERMLIGDTFAATAGAALSALAFWWIAPTYTVVGLLLLGPVFCAPRGRRRRHAATFALRQTSSSRLSGGSGSIVRPGFRCRDTPTTIL